MNNEKRNLLVTAVLIFFLSSLNYGQQFKFAWLTDTHVGNLTGSEDLLVSVNDINTLPDIDFVIISGDITETGKTRDLYEAKSILDKLHKPYYIIPGNHDTKWSESGCTMFSKIFGNELFKLDYQGIRFIGMHQGPIMRMADGHFSPESLRALDSLLSITDKKIPIVFVAHYPLDEQIDNWYTAIERLKKFNTQVVLCGHGHANRALNFEGIPGVMARSNLRAKQTIGGYTIAEVREGNILFSERTPNKETKTVWNKVNLRKVNYSADTKKYSRPDYSVNELYHGVNIKWKFQTNFTVVSSPVIYDNSVYVASGSGFFYCVSLESGIEKWRFKSDGANYGTPAVSNDRVVFGSTDKNIYCVNASTGKFVWKFETDAPVVAVPFIKENTVYIGGGDGKFRAINLNDGKLIWEFSGLEEFVETKPLVYDDKVIFGAWDSYLYALNIKDGTLAWKWQGTKGFLFSPAACWAVSSNEKIFVVAPDRVATAIDSQTGKTIWRTSAHQVRESIGISEDGKYVYAKGMNDSLFVYSALSDDFKLIKAINCGFGYEIAPSMPMEKDGIVFLGTKNGLVIAVNKEKLEVIWKYKTGVSMINTVAPVSGKKVVVTNMDGEVMLIESANK